MLLDVDVDPAVGGADTFRRLHSLGARELGGLHPASPGKLGPDAFDRFDVHHRMPAQALDDAALRPFMNLGGPQRDPCKVERFPRPKLHTRKRASVDEVDRPSFDPQVPPRTDELDALPSASV
ncbi:MAG: hypothetical protein JRJ24_03320 [Deltaproteobacteria bacterium]|nr:hypothetical protein [Deltaproteobacteria bacterium]